MQRLFFQTRPLRHVTRLAPGCRKGNGIHTGPGVLPIPPSIPTLENASQSDLARAWIERFKTRDIPKSMVEMTYSRSSGPGGQNVNKVNTKATLRCPIDAPWIPPWAREHIKKTAQNVQDCLAKLHTLIVSAASAGLVNGPSEAQQERVRQLARVEKARRRLDKDKRKEVKRGRGGGRGDWD